MSGSTTSSHHHRHHSHRPHLRRSKSLNHSGKTTTESDERFRTSRSSARRAGYASSEDERFVTPRGSGGNLSSRSSSSSSSESDLVFLSARVHPHADVSSSKWEGEDVTTGFYSSRSTGSSSGSGSGLGLGLAAHVEEEEAEGLVHYQEDRGEYMYGYSYDPDAKEQPHLNPDTETTTAELGYDESSYYGYHDEHQHHHQYHYHDEHEPYTETQPHMKHNDDVDVTDIFSVCRHNKVHRVNELLDQGLPVNVSDPGHGNTLLIIAAQNGLKKMAKAVLRRGADINKVNHQGNTPLHFCFEYGYGDTLGAYLISKGADTSILNYDGYSCYDGLTGVRAPPPPHHRSSYHH